MTNSTNQIIIMKKLITVFLCFFFFQIVSAQNEFITTWKPGNSQNPLPNSPPFASSDTQAWAPFQGTNFTIYWEEIGYPSHNMTLQNVTSSNYILLDFGPSLNPVPASATYKVKVSNGNGNFHRISFRDDVPSGNVNNMMGDYGKIVEINQWGCIAWSSMAYAFERCENLNMTATDVPDLTAVTSLDYMFSGCSTLIGNNSINNWNISSVNSLVGTFNGCFVFNQPIGNWNTSNVQNMGVLFLMCQNFNQPIGNWNTSQVVSMDGMFNNARSFNQPIGNWDVSNVIEMEFMFAYAWGFNQPLENWNVSGVIEMDYMFLSAKLFNQPIGSWNTSSVTTMNGMFLNATAFNQPIGNWNTASVLTMNAMFQNASAFNQNIGNWNTSQVTTIQSMFMNASSFNKDLGKWNLTSIVNANNMFLNSGLNCQNYDSTLYGWSLNPSTPNNIILSSVSPMTYAHPAAVTARNYLINNKGWSIVGDTYDAECSSVLSTTENIAHANLSIYPNPASDFIFIKNLKNPANYKISDTSGRLLKEGKIVSEKVDVNVLPKGNYILQIVTKDNIQSYKFIKK